MVVAGNRHVVSGSRHGMPNRNRQGLYPSNRVRRDQGPIDGVVNGSEQVSLGQPRITDPDDHALTLQHKQAEVVGNGDSSPQSGRGSARTAG